jgi:CubicO group peptidase (beta-lactamase class C family)
MPVDRAPVRAEGTVAPGFERVVDAFEANFVAEGDVGAAVCAYVDGRPVVDLWGGLADHVSGRPWERNTPVVVFSVTKGPTVICIHRLAERGLLDVDAPVADVWPEFAAAGKADIPVRWVLSHRSGVAAVDAPVTWDDVAGWDGVVAAIAAQRPYWPPGTQHGYHVRTFGWILGEVVRRCTGRSLGAVFADEIAMPLGLDFWIGLPEELEPALARVIPPDPAEDPSALAIDDATDDTLFGKAAKGPGDLFAYDERWNTRRFHAAEMPSSSGIANARAVARMYAATVGDVDGVRLLEPDTIRRAALVQSDGMDAVLGWPTKVGLGFALPPFLGPECPPGAFGHGGAGGSLGFADPDLGLGFGYVTSRMKLGAPAQDRASALLRALKQCL